MSRMEASFTRDEKLFVLAEVIKSSDIDIDKLLAFIKINHVVPAWMNMQLPFGRNMNQCMQLVEHLTGDSSHAGRRVWGSQAQPSATRRTASQVHHTSSPHATDVAPVAILPRPVKDGPQNNNCTASSPSNAAGKSPTTQPPPPKKRGRPSRADKAKKDLRPILPPHLAPRPSPGSGHRPILPAAGRSDDNQARAAAVVAYSSSAPEPLDSFRGRKRRRLFGIGKQPQNDASGDKMQANSSVPGSTA